jgi:hypothetical protein
MDAVPRRYECPCICALPKSSSLTSHLFLGFSEPATVLPLFSFLLAAFSQPILGLNFLSKFHICSMLLV